MNKRRRIKIIDFVILDESIITVHFNPINGNDIPYYQKIWRTDGVVSHYVTVYNDRISHLAKFLKLNKINVSISATICGSHLSIDSKKNFPGKKEFMVLEVMDD